MVTLLFGTERVLVPSCSSFSERKHPPSPTHPPPPKKMLFKFQKFAYILRNGKRMTILLWGVWSYFGKQQRSLLKGSPRWKAWPENLKMTRVWKQWAISWSGCRGCSFFFFFFSQGCFAVQSSWQCEAVPKLLVPEKWGGLCLGWAVCPPLECCWSSLRSSHGTARTQNCQHTQAKSQVRNARTCNYHAGPDERDTADWSILGFPSSLAFYHRMRRMKFASFVYLKP